MYLTHYETFSCEKMSEVDYPTWSTDAEGEKGSIAYSRFFGGCATVNMTVDPDMKARRQSVPDSGFDRKLESMGATDVGFEDLLSFVGGEWTLDGNIGVSGPAGENQFWEMTWPSRFIHPSASANGTYRDGHLETFTRDECF